MTRNVQIGGTWGTWVHLTFTVARIIWKENSCMGVEDRFIQIKNANLRIVKSLTVDEKNWKFTPQTINRFDTQSKHIIELLSNIST